MINRNILQGREDGRAWLGVLVVVVIVAALVVVAVIRLRGDGGAVEPAGTADTAGTADNDDGGKPVVTIVESTLTPGIYLLNEDYDRTKSRMLKRRVVGPTLARIDFAAYDSNVLMFDPADYKPNPPEKKVPLTGLDFDGSLEKDSLCDRLEQTPLTEAEKGVPLAWVPVREHLMLWNDEQPEDAVTDLPNAGAAVSGCTWNDPNMVRPYQEVSRVYLHKADDGYEMWARVEFKPWVKFLEGVDDEDDDGFPEIYGRIRRDAMSETVAEELLSNYIGKTLDAQEIADWAYDLGSYWYPSYMTYTLKPEPLEPVQWDDQASRPEFDKVLGALLEDEKVTIVIRGKPFDRFIYLALYIESAKDK